jgi:hypothetical protein
MDALAAGARARERGMARASVRGRLALADGTLNVSEELRLS